MNILDLARDLCSKTITVHGQPLTIRALTGAELLRIYKAFPAPKPLGVRKDPNQPPTGDIRYIPDDLDPVYRQRIFERSHRLSAAIVLVSTGYDLPAVTTQEEEKQQAKALQAAVEQALGAMPIEIIDHIEAEIRKISTEYLKAEVGNSSPAPCEGPPNPSDSQTNTPSPSASSSSESASGSDCPRSAPEDGTT